MDHWLNLFICIGRCVSDWGLTHGPYSQNLGMVFLFGPKVLVEMKKEEDGDTEILERKDWEC